MLNYLKRAQKGLKIATNIKPSEISNVLKLQSTSTLQSKLFSSTIKAKFQPMTGNEAAASISYAVSENSFIYPITPSSQMAELFDEWHTKGMTNIWGKDVTVKLMQSEAGAAGAVHGSLASGSLTTTFTASQGLLLKIPNMFLIAGELMPTVFHIAARSLHKHALSIHGDHMDVMHARTTGWAQLVSTSVQECHDNSLIAHLATLHSRIPFIHFFDGFRTSHEIQKIETISYDQIRAIYPEDALKKNLRDLQLTPHNPIMRGTGQRPEYFFQAAISAQPYYDNCPNEVEKVMKQVSTLTGRRAELFEYTGCKDPESLIIIMGSAADTVEDTVNYINARDDKAKVGCIKVRLYRPWSYKHINAVIPQSVKHIAVLDRTKEDGSSGQPLYQDIVCTMDVFGRKDIKITSSVYGLSSKEFTPAMVKAIFDNCKLGEKALKFNVVGINDDLNKQSLPIGPEFDPAEKSQKSQCIFWGLGSDGTVGANQASISTIANQTDLKVQGYFAYDAYKTDGVTCSHLRFGKDAIKAPYMISSNANYIACHNKKYVQNLDMLKPLKPKGIFVLNSSWLTVEDMEKNLPAHMMRTLAEKDALFYTLDATQIAQDVGLRKRINSIMQTVFYKLSQVLPGDEAVQLLKKDVTRQYSKKGQHIVDMNIHAIDETIKNLVKIDYPKEKWLKIDDSKGLPKQEIIKTGSKEEDTFYNEVFRPILDWKGDEIPVSKFTPGGYMQIKGTTSHEKRQVAVSIPIWKPNDCTQCNICSIVCPHAAIRPVLLDRDQVKNAPKNFQTAKAKGGQEVAGLSYSINVTPDDCTGCEVCVHTCPDNALYMAPIELGREKGALENWQYSQSLPFRENKFEKFTTKGSQFEQPLLQYSGACAGCGETPYVKLLTQLFGDRMVIANATGCSMIWGSMYPSNPYTIRKESQRGPAYGHSLFEDNAEYGFGMVISNYRRKQNLIEDMKNLNTKMRTDINKDGFRKLVDTWLKNIKNPQVCEDMYKQISEALTQLSPQDFSKYQELATLKSNLNLLTVNSYWLIGGDGWAYDIGFGGVDHVLSSNANFNIMILDTEMYSNTGGQESKATPTGATVKFHLGGKESAKKDVGLQIMSYGHVYVASIALGGNYQQSIQALKEAESFDGPSLIIALSPCIQWGFENNNIMGEIQKLAVESGYWPLYRFDPRKTENKFQLDQQTIKRDIGEYLEKQLRFTKLKREQPELAGELQTHLRKTINQKFNIFQRMSLNDYDMLDYLKRNLGEVVTSEKSLILYGSESGHAKALAEEFQYQLKRRDIRSKILALDDQDIGDLPNNKNVYVLVSTAGQGDMPTNAQQFWEKLNKDLPADYLKDTKFAVFGLGDSSYVYFNKAAKDLDTRFAKLGGKRLVNVGLGDDKDEDRYEHAWYEWFPQLQQEAGMKQPKGVLFPATFAITPSEEPDHRYIPAGYYTLPVKQNKLMTPEGYNRDIRHYIFDLHNTKLQYAPGDVLTVLPHNNEELVKQFLDRIQIHANQSINIDSISQDSKRVLPKNITYKRLFSEVIDIFGKPSRNLFEFLSIYSTKETDKKQLKYLLTPEGKDDFNKLVAETVTVADLLEKFPTATPSVEYMIEYFPLIKPRLYSIASAQEFSGDNLELCIILNDWKTPSGKYRQGLTTSYLKTLQQGKDEITCKLSAGAIPFPEKQQSAILVCLGTGIAPVRSFIQDRAAALKKGEKLGQTFVVFGNRHKKSEYLFEQELEQFKKDGVVTDIWPAFSRDQEKKVYVNHKIEENANTVYDVLFKQKGFFYLCGQAGAVPDGVRKAIVKAFQTSGSMSVSDAENFITQMRLDGKYNLDVW